MRLLVVFLFSLNLLFILEHRARPEGGSTAPVKRVAYLWDGDVIAYEKAIEPDGSITKVDWYFEPSTFVPIARKELDYLSYVVTDHLGTPKEIVGETGHLEWAAEYRTWGEIKRLEAHAPKPRSKPQTEHDQWGFIPLDAEGSAVRDLHEKPGAYYCPIRFQGQWEDAETELYYNRFRYYEPSIGFLSSDPIGLRGGLRAHGYVRYPTLEVDYRGLSPCINVRHIFHGEINNSGRPVGFHHEGSIGHNGRARVKRIISPPNQDGVYEAEVEIYNSRTRCWMSKRSSMFPRNWSRARVLNEIRGAFANGSVAANGKFSGVSPSGIRIEGWMLGPCLNTAYPIY